MKKEVSRLLSILLFVSYYASGFKLTHSFKIWKGCIAGVGDRYQQHDQSGTLLSYRRVSKDGIRELATLQRGRKQERAEPATGKMKGNPSHIESIRRKGSSINAFLSSTIGWSIKSISSVIFIALAIWTAYIQSVPKSDIIFSILFTVYLIVANIIRFDRNTPAISSKRQLKPLLFVGRGPWFSRYIKSFALAGLVIPFLIQILAPLSVSNPSSPHFYLILCQCALEGLTYNEYSHPLIRLLVPIGFNTWRMNTLMQWTMRGWDDLWEDVMMKKSGWNIWILAQTSPWKVVGFSLAFVNLIMWAYNLFIFLLLRTVPQYLDPVEFPSSEEVVWKGQLFPVVLTDKKSK